MRISGVLAMPNLAERYQWSATMPDGTVLARGGDLTGAVAVSLTAVGVLLPNHTFTGLTFIRRFGRGFLNAMGGGMKEYIHCIVCEQCRIYLYSSSGAVVITPTNYELYL